MALGAGGGGDRRVPATASVGQRQQEMRRGGAGPVGPPVSAHGRDGAGSTPKSREPRGDVPCLLFLGVYIGV
jgi:hypothetical protein